jgi:hypothetical protein
MITACIPTKSRPQTQTYKLFESVGIKVVHFVEPSQFAEYDVPGKVKLAGDNLGLVSTRNFILDWARKNDEEWILMCDDDVKGFGVYNGKTVKLDASIWLDIYEKVKNFPFEIVGINYVQHAWHEKTVFSVNKKYAEVCVLLNVQRIKWQYDVPLKEDRDMCLQAVKKGAGVLRFNKYWFSCPDVGTNTGGLQDEYRNKKDERGAVELSRKWHPFVKLRTRNGRLDAQVKLADLARHYGKEVK